LDPGAPRFALDGERLDIVKQIESLSADGPQSGQAPLCGQLAHARDGDAKPTSDDADFGEERLCVIHGPGS
jgi:hypothetical protein